MKFPNSVKKTIWYGNIEDETRPETVITAVFNRGNIEAIGWVLNNYDRELLENTVKNPDRGMWDRKSLHFWEKYFDIELSDEVKQEAIVDPKKF